MNKKVFNSLLVILLIIFSFILFGCKKDENDINKDEEAILKVIDECKIVYSSEDSSNSIKENITFIDASDTDVTFTWSSSNEDVITKEGIVTRQDKDTDVVITVTALLNDASFSKSFNLKVIAKEKENNTSGGDNNQNSNPDNNENENVIVSAKFDEQIKGNTPIIEGWDLHVAKKGAYDTGWTSFRDNGEYVISAKFEEINSVEVKFVYYLNNVSTNGNKSSKIEFQALDKDGNVLTTYLSNELNDEQTRSSSKSPKVIKARLDAENIVSIKVLFKKDGGGNIGFSLIEISK